MHIEFDPTDIEKISNKIAEIVCEKLKENQSTSLVDTDGLVAYLNDSKCLVFYIEKIKERTGERKTLFVGEENSFLSDAIYSVKPQEIKDAGIEDQPAIFALGAVVCVLDSRKFEMESIHEAELALEELMEAKYLRNIGF